MNLSMSVYRPEGEDFFHWFDWDIARPEGSESAWRAAACDGHDIGERFKQLGYYEFRLSHPDLCEKCKRLYVMQELAE